MQNRARYQFWAFLRWFNSLPDTPILGSSNSAANKDMMSNRWTKGGYNYLIE